MGTFVSGRRLRFYREETNPARLLSSIQLSQSSGGAECMLIYWNSGLEEVIVPLKEVKISARVESGITKTTAELTYTNALSNEPVEVYFYYPLLRSQVIDS